ncbi:MAG TPA: hypothetical protein VFM29_00080, partial [Vicinamibacteria bacterium]|nr:hypothetical protein [Vicinamibacteria bacterium]
MAGTSIDTGRRVAAWLRGAWREHPPRAALAPGDLEAAAAVLNRSGCAGLGWWAVRETDLASTTIGRALQDAFRLQVLGAAMRDQAVAGLFERLDAASVFAVLGKGWAAAEAY